MTSVESKREEKVRRHGYDVFRLLAMSLVVLQHLKSLFNIPMETEYFGLEIGQIGVAIFLAISGVLIGRDSRSPADWLLARLVRIYPAYWVVTLLAFALTAYFGSKPTSIVQLLWQMSGLGMYFIPELVNIVTWFIGLLLALYFSVFLMKSLGVLLPGVWIASAVSSMLLVINPYELYFVHALAFYLSIAISSSKSDGFVSWVCVIALLCCAVRMRVFGYAAMGVVSIPLAEWIGSVPAWVSILAKYSYEFYLVHGIVFVGVRRFLGGHSVVAIGLGIVLGGFVAVMLQRGVSWGIGLGRVFRWQRKLSDRGSSLVQRD
jgi:peptidoglycan/LPS O-acetylase OafA/YrhL